MPQLGFTLEQVEFSATTSGLVVRAHARPEWSVGFFGEDQKEDVSPDIVSQEVSFLQAIRQSAPVVPLICREVSGLIGVSDLLFPSDSGLRKTALAEAILGKWKPGRGLPGGGFFWGNGAGRAGNLVLFSDVTHDRGKSLLPQLLQLCCSQQERGGEASLHFQFETDGFRPEETAGPYATEREFLAGEVPLFGRGFGFSVRVLLR